MLTRMRPGSVTAPAPDSKRGTGRPTLLIANPSADIYGSDLQMLETVAAMVEQDWRVVAVIPDDGPLVPMLNDRGAEVRLAQFPVLRRADASARGIGSLAARALRAMPVIHRELRKLAPTAVYVNTVTIPWWITGSRLARIPVVCHVHEAEAADRKLLRVALNAPLLAANSLIAISPVTADATTRDIRCLTRRTHLIYNGVPGPDTNVALAGPLDTQSRSADAPRSSRSMTANSFRLAVVGRLSPRKATDVALEAVATLRRAGRDVHLEICGTPFTGYEWFENDLHARAAAPDLAGAVTFSGYVSPVWPALIRADAILAPSTREPFGNVVVEAQFAGRPVIAASAMGHLETVIHERTGLLVRPGDPTSMAAAIIRLMDDANLSHEITKQAAKRAHEKFSVTRYANDVVDLIGALCESPGQTKG